MGDYKFTEELSQKIVRGIEQGYSNYAEIRREKQQELYVSGAYAWVKGNHIEDQVARELQHLGIQFEIAKAGYTWQYLRFADHEQKRLFLVKNVSIIKDKKRSATLDTTNSDNYLVKMSQINNNQNLNELKGSIQGTLTFDLPPVSAESEEEGLDELNNQFDSFQIITYAIDKESKFLKDIDLWIPEYQSGSNVELYKVESLNRFLGDSGADVNQEAIKELVKLPEEEYSGTPEEFGYRELGTKTDKSN